MWRAGLLERSRGEETTAHPAGDSYCNQISAKSTAVLTLPSLKYYISAPTESQLVFISLGGICQPSSLMDFSLALYT